MPVKPPPSLAPADVSPLLAGLSAGNLVLGGKDNRLINSRRCSLIGSNNLVVGRSYNHHVFGSEEESKAPTIALANYNPADFRGIWIETSLYEYGHVVLHSDGYYYVYNSQVNNSLQWGQTIPPDGFYTSGGIAIWIKASIDVSVSDNVYEFDGFSSNNETFMQNTGTYYFSNVPESHPIAFMNKGKPVRYGGESWAGRRTIEGNEYDFFSGSVVLDIMGDFGIMSYSSLGGYMGGYQNIIFDISSPSPNRGTLSVNLDYSNYTESALTIEDQDTLRKMCDYFQNVIISDMGVWNAPFYKEGEFLEGAFNYQLNVVNFSPEKTSGPSGTLAFAGPNNVTRELTSLARSDYGFFVTPVNGRMAVDPLDLDYLRQETEYPNKNKLYWTMLHEVGHAFGIGTLWNTTAWTGAIGNNFIRLTEQNGAQYIGKNAVREYNRLVGGNFESLPVQTFMRSTRYNTSDPNKFLKLEGFTSLPLTLDQEANQLIFNIRTLATDDGGNPTLKRAFILNTGFSGFLSIGPRTYEDGFYIFHGAGQDPGNLYWNDEWMSRLESYENLFVAIPENIAPYDPDNPEDFPDSAIGLTFTYDMYLTWLGHWAEITADSITDGRKYRLYTNPDGTTVEQPYITEEIMTPYFDGYAPWTRMSTAFLHDLGYIVDYSQDNPIFDTSNEYSIIESKNPYKETTDLITNPYFTTNLNGWFSSGDVELLENGNCVMKNAGSISQSVGLFINVTYYLTLKIRGSVNVSLSASEINSTYVDSGNPMPEIWDPNKIYQLGDIVFCESLTPIGTAWVASGTNVIYFTFDPSSYFDVGDIVLINNEYLTVSAVLSSGNSIRTIENYSGSTILQESPASINVVVYGIYERGAASPGTSGSAPSPDLPPDTPAQYIYWDIIEVGFSYSFSNYSNKNFGHELAAESTFEIPITPRSDIIKFTFSHTAGVSCSIMKASLSRQLIKNNSTAFVEDNHAMNVFGELICSGDIFTSHISDERLKKHVKPIDNCLDKILGMSAIQFDWNERQNTYSGRDIGLIAQQVESVCPEIVETRKSGFKAIRYEKISALLVGSIKESQEKINKIKQRINYES